METNIRYTLVGAFVVILFACIVLGVIWLSSGLTTETYDIYKIYMKESVSGLSIDSTVEFNGVTVGNVYSIEIGKKDPQLVEVLIRIKSSTPVSQGTRAMINTRGFTGIAYLTLQDKGALRTHLAILPGEKYPVISTSPSLFLRIDAAIGQFSENFRRISAAIETLLGSDNQESLREILQNLRLVTLQLTPIMKSGLDTMQIVANQTLPATNQAMANIESITRNLMSITNDLKQNPAVLIRGKAPPPLGPGEK